MSAEYILQHSRRESRHVQKGSCPKILIEGETNKIVITGAIIMLVGILVGYAIARNNADNL